MRVAVIGGGIGGLATAAGLQRAGMQVTVHERSDRPAGGGSGISLFGNGLTALAALGLAEPARVIGAVPGGPIAAAPAGQRRPDGRWLVRLPPAATRTVAVVHRADLHRMLLDALAPGTVHLGAAVDWVTDGGRTIEVDGTRRTVDVVVAADGIRSRVRAGRPGDPGVRPAGYVAWRGVTDRPVDVGSGTGETVGRGLRFGIAPLADGRVYWFAVRSQPAGAPVPDGPDAVLDLFGAWHAPIAELIRATPPDRIQALPIEELAGPLPTFRHGRCVLLGDAAHAMTPNLGQGGNQALEDAATLVALLAGTDGTDGTDGADTVDTVDTVDAALTTYDRLRRPRTRRIARQARLLGRVLQAHGPVTSRLRDTALRLTPPGAAAHGALAVQRWETVSGDAVRPDGTTGAAGR